MVDIFRIKKNDTKPAIGVTLQYSNGSALDLTNGSVFFQMGNLNTYAAYFSGACIITNATAGQCEYRWLGSPDLQTPGTYWGEFQVAWTGSTMTLPSNHNLKIEVFEDYN